MWPEQNLLQFLGSVFIEMLGMSYSTCFKSTEVDINYISSVTRNISMEGIGLHIYKVSNLSILFQEQIIIKLKLHIKDDTRQSA